MATKIVFAGDESDWLSWQKANKNGHRWLRLISSSIKNKSLPVVIRLKACDKQVWANENRR
jgi:hypothetical protein